MRLATVENLTRCVIALVSEQDVQSAAEVVVQAAGELGEVISLGRRLGGDGADADTVMDRDAGLLLGSGQHRGIGA